MKELPEFDELMKMAKEEPEKLEMLRRAWINELIESASDENIKLRLKQLQFQIDGIRVKSKHPLHATQQISEMMLDRVEQLNSVLKEFQKIEEPKEEKKKSFFKIIKGSKKEEPYSKDF